MDGANFVLCGIIIFLKSTTLCLLFFLQRRFWILIEHILNSHIKFQQNWSLSGYHEFCEEDDIDVENILRSAFGGSRTFYWSFINEGNPHWGRSGNFSNFGKSWNWRHQSDKGYGSSNGSESESESECLRSNSVSVSDRLALGLSASGPLKLEDVKIAWVLFPLFVC
jgi:hypothetical protein